MLVHAQYSLYAPSVIGIDERMDGGADSFGAKGFFSVRAQDDVVSDAFLRGAGGSDTPFGDVGPNLLRDGLATGLLTGGADSDLFSLGRAGPSEAAIDFGAGFDPNFLDHTGLGLTPSLALSQPDADFTTPALYDVAFGSLDGIPHGPGGLASIVLAEILGHFSPGPHSFALM